jgi:hypothetical protein
LENTGTVRLHRVGGLSFRVPRRDGRADNVGTGRIYNAAGDGGRNILAPGRVLAPEAHRQ